MKLKPYFPLILGHICVYGILLAFSDVWLFPTILITSLLIVVILIWISIEDILTYTIPDLANIILFFSGLIFTLWQTPSTFYLHLMASAFWALLFWLIAISFRNLKGYDGLGLGDVKLMASAGIWLGIIAPISVVLYASLSGIFFAIVSGLIRKKSYRNIQDSAIAFGPFLCLSIWVVWLFGPLG